jgi:predicted dehydrogenase
MSTLKLAIVGAGAISGAHLRALSTVDHIEVVAIADIDLSRAENRAAEFGIPHTYVDYQEMIDKEDAEAVSVLTWNEAHAAPSIYALEAGKHVLVEKPMAATLDDAVAMTQAAKKSDKLLMVGLKARYGDDRIVAQTIADSGVLGDIYYGESGGFGRLGLPGGSFITKETAGIGVVGDWGVYSLDATLCLMGHPKPVAVSGVANNFLGKDYSPIFGARHHGGDFSPELLSVEDFGAAWVRFDTGAVITFKAAWISHLSGSGSPFLLGTKAGLKLHPLTLYRWEFGMLTDTQPMNYKDTEPIEQFRRENVAFAEAIAKGLPSPIPAEQLLLTNVIMQGLVDSAAVGHEIEVSVPEI